jgi:hypothetical protein
MLSPEARSVATDILRPPVGYTLEHAVITTYSLDLDVILALPLAVLAQSDQGIEELLADPMLTLEALREAGERLDIFVDETSIGVPQTHRPLYAMLEQSVHPTRAPNDGAFHPKLWVIRFSNESDTPLLRVAVLSRNLTYDRSWDVALISETTPESRGTLEASQALGELLHALPDLAVHGIAPSKAEQLQSLADLAARCAFPAPDRFKNPIYFEILGLTPGATAPWYPWEQGADLLAIAPFVNVTGLTALASRSNGHRTLISRREALDNLPESALAQWQEVMMLSEAAVDEAEDEMNSTSDLHAKLIALEHSSRVTWYLGSANFTAAAYTGRNVEAIASINGPNNQRKNTDGYGITQFKESGFLNLCEPYQRVERPSEDPALNLAREQLEKYRASLSRSNISISCEPHDERWHWRIKGMFEIPPEVTVMVWPVSVREDQARIFEEQLVWSLPMERLTAFVAFRLSVSADVDDVRMVLKLPVTGMPDGRASQILRGLIDSPERFMQFLRALLGGLEGMTGWATDGSGGTWEGDWGNGLEAETLLEDLVRVAARDPDRLNPIRRLISDLQSADDGTTIVPEDFLELWRVVEASVSKEGRS